MSKIYDSDFLDFVENFDIVCFLETFMIENALPNNIFKSFLPAFILPANASAGRGRNSGGIIVLVKIQFTNIVQRVETDFKNSIVLLFKNVLAGTNKNLIFVSTYIHPSGSPFYNNFETKNGIHMFEDSFHKLFNKYNDSEFLISGDFNARIDQCQPYEELVIADKYIENINTLSFFDKNYRDDLSRKSEDKTINNFGKSFIEFLASYKFIVLNGLIKGDKNGCFTYISQMGNSVIDYFVVSESLFNYCVEMTVHSRVESTHMPIHVNIEIPTTIKERYFALDKSYKHTYLKWDNDKLSQFMHKCCEYNIKSYVQNLNNVLETDVNECITMLCEFYHSASSMMNKTMSEFNNYNHSFFDNECYQQKLVLRKYLRKYQRCKSDENKTAYSNCRKNYKSFIEKKRHNFNCLKKETLLKNFKNQKLFWKEIKSISVSKNRNNNIDIKDFFIFYKSIFQTASEPPPICTEENQETYFNFDNQDPHFITLNSDISLSEVEQSLKSIKLNKSPGPDNILNEMLQSTSSDITPFLTNLFQFIFKNHIFPNEWTKSIIIPIHKKGDINVCNNYRPISLTSLLSKLYTNILNKRLTLFVESNNILPIEQAGFREKFSTVDHIFTLYSMIHKQFAKDRKLYVAFIDYSKCFDTVNKHAMFNVLERNGIKGEMLESIKSLYTKVSACIRNNGDMSDYFECPNGLKQGCMLSPRLFTIFISEISRVLNATCTSGIQFLSNFAIIHHLFFADDIILVSDTIQGLQNKLNVLESQSIRLGLTVNLDKTKIMVFRKGGRLSKFEKWFYGQNPIEIVNKYVYLGFVFTTTMSIKSSLSSFIMKAKLSINTILSSLNSIDCHEMNIFFKLFDSKVLPILSYSSEFWGVFSIEAIERVHTLAIKRFLKVSIHSSNAIVYAETGRVPLSINLIISSIKYWFKLLRKPDSYLNKQAYLMMLKNCENGKENWVMKVKNILCENGFGIAWLCQNVDNENAVLRDLKIRLTDIFFQNWNSKISNNENYVFYHSFKSFITPESYLNSQKIDITSRTCLTRLRCGVSKLNAHRYRYYNDESLMNCPFCENHIENEIHSIFFCPYYSNLRSKFLDKKFLENRNLNTLAILISNEHYQIQLSKYLKAMFSARKRMIDKT